MTYAKLYEYGCLQLKAADIPDYKIDARLLLEHVCGTNASDLYTKGDHEVEQNQELEYLNSINRRKTHEPLQHITGVQGFMGLDFKVSKDVLIPRPDTEILVETVLKDLHDGMRVLDMCTGSGCILLSLLHYSNDCTGVGADISPKALKIARENADSLGINAEFVESDLFSNIQGKFDVFVSNPPYIRTCEIEELMPEVRDFDPFIALNGHENGIYFYERILDGVGEHLFRGSLVAFEIGNDQGKSVSELMESHGYTSVTVIKDYAGNDRVVKGYFK